MDPDTIFREGGYSIPVDPNFIISQVKAANCPWAGVEPDGALPWRETRADYCLEQADGVVMTTWNYNECDFVRTHYQCNACGVQATDDHSLRESHPTIGVYLRSGFGFDPGRGLFVASAEPGALMFLVSIKPNDWWRPNPPPANTTYAQRHGLLTNWTPLYQGLLRKGAYSACTFLVLQAHQTAS